MKHTKYILISEYEYEANCVWNGLINTSLEKLKGFKEIMETPIPDIKVSPKLLNYHIYKLEQVD